MIGQRIFFFRKSKGMTQEQLAQGICSISHLSKIENGHEIPSKDIITHLCNRLGISIHDIDSKEEMEQFSHILEEWYSLMVSKDRTEANKLFPIIEEKLGQIQDPSLLLKYKLYYVRFTLMNYKADEATEKLGELNQYYKSFDLEQKYLFHFLTGMLVYIQGDYSESLTLLKKAEEICEELRLIDPELYYMLGLAHLQLHDITFSINYASQALEIFHQNFQINRSLECEILIGINNRRLKNYSAAEKHYLNALKVSKSLKLNELIYMNYHNLGVLYRDIDSQKAIYYFQECLKYFHANEHEMFLKEERYCQTCFSLAEEYFELGDFKEMFHWIEKGENIANKHDLVPYVLHFKVLRCRLNDYDDFFKENTLKDEVIPYFIEKKIWLYVSEYAQLLADLYYKNNKYKSASQYYQLVIQANRNIFKL